jgi:hypothetical protein
MLPFSNATSATAFKSKFDIIFDVSIYIHQHKLIERVCGLVVKVTV